MIRLMTARDISDKRFNETTACTDEVVLSVVQEILQLLRR